LILEISPVLFGAAIDKTICVKELGEEAPSPKIAAIQLIAPRFDAFLRRLADNGMMSMDSEERRKDRKLKHVVASARKRRPFPDPSGSFSSFDNTDLLSNVIENVVFVDSEDSPLVQLADFCAYATWNHLEKGKSLRFGQISHLFDTCDDGSGIVEWPPRKQNNGGKGRPS